VQKSAFKMKKSRLSASKLEKKKRPHAMGKFMWKLKNSPIGKVKCKNSIFFGS